METEKYDKLYVNLKKKRKMLSNISFKEDDVYDAHSLKLPATEVYISATFVKEALSALKKTDQDKIIKTLDLD